MSVRNFRRAAGRAQLGSPIISVNSSAAYLRHRAAAQRRERAARQARRLRQALIVLIGAALYFAIGRDLIRLAVARGRTASTQVRHDTQSIVKGVSRLLQAGDSPGGEAASPWQFTSAAALARDADPDDPELWISPQPVPVSSRAR
jgi:hypothetical protein